MEQNLVNDAGELNIVASTGSSASDFDFNFGKWKIHNRKLKKRLQNCNDWVEFESTLDCYPVLRGLGNVDHYKTEFDGAPFEGMTVRLFNPKTRLWSLYWTASNVMIMDVPVVGSFDGATGEFYAKDVWEGKKIIMRFHWDRSNPQAPTWSQAFSTDHGKTWEWNWYMTSSRPG